MTFALLDFNASALPLSYKNLYTIRRQQKKNQVRENDDNDDDNDRDDDDDGKGNGDNGGDDNAHTHE